LTRSTLDRFKAMRRPAPGGSYSDVIIRVARGARIPETPSNSMRLC
jgi:hypothetical protein